MKNYFVYILANGFNGTLYVGVTSDLDRRLWEHKVAETGGFAEKYAVNRLVHYEIFDDPENAIKREKRLKHWNRQWKIELIEKNNPAWKDLYDEFFKTAPSHGSSGQAGG